MRGELISGWQALFSIHFHVARLVIFSIFDRNSFCLSACTTPFFHVFTPSLSFSLSFSLSLVPAHFGHPLAAFLADKLDSIIANHDGGDDSHVADRPASWQREGKGVEMSPSLGSTSRWSVTVARSLTPRRVQHEKKSISWILLSLAVRAATSSVGIHSSELITAPAPARRIVITLPTPCTPLSFFPPLLTRGQVTHYLDIVSFFASYGTKESFSFSGYLE